MKPMTTGDRNRPGPVPRRFRGSRGLNHGLLGLPGLLVAALAAACGPGLPPGQADLASRDARSVPERLHPEADEAISKLRSPFCPGLMLEVCPSLEAEALRDSIQLGAEAGLSADSLVERMIAVHGEEYRAFPERSGTGLLAWTVPPAALLLGLATVVIVLRRLKSREPVGAGAEELTEEERERLAEALAQLEAAEDME